jgi:predicted chitinase
MVTSTQLKTIMPGALPKDVAKYLDDINAAMETFEINTVRRMAAFLGELAQESGELRYMEEIWGPTPDQREYEPPSKKATELGNVHPGDGYRFRGRGPIQITGRTNYGEYGGLLKIDLVDNPDQAAEPQVGFKIAGCFWLHHGLNELADAQNFHEITKRINGGYSHLMEREAYYHTALRTLGSGDVP